MRRDWISDLAGDKSCGSPVTHHNVSTAMEFWLRETMREQPYHALSAVKPLENGSLERASFFGLVEVDEAEAASLQCDGDRVKMHMERANAASGKGT